MDFRLSPEGVREQDTLCFPLFCTTGIPRLHEDYQRQDTVFHPGFETMVTCPIRMGVHMQDIV
jgi:hypothetical protein